MSTGPTTAHPWWLRTLRWPLWSWRRLGLTAAAFVVVTSAASIGHDAFVRATGGPQTAAVGAVGAATGPTAGDAAPTVAPSGIGPTGAPGGSPSSVPTPITTPTQTPSTSAAVSPATPATPDQLAAARAFVVAWARPSLDAPTWYAALRPLVTARLATLLHATDPARVPASRVLDPAPSTSPRTPAPGRAGTTQQVTVHTDGGAVTVSLLSDGKHWLVDSIAPTGQPG